MSERKVYKSAVDGRWVSKEYAATHSDTTFAETIQVDDTGRIVDPVDDEPTTNNDSGERND